MSDECSDMNVHYTLNPFRKRLEMGKAHYPHTIAVQVPIKIKTKKMHQQLRLRECIRKIYHFLTRTSSQCKYEISCLEKPLNALNSSFQSVIINPLSFSVFYTIQVRMSDSLSRIRTLNM